MTLVAIRVKYLPPTTTKGPRYRVQVTARPSVTYLVSREIQEYASACKAYCTMMAWDGCMVGGLSRNDEMTYVFCNVKEPHTHT